MQIRRGLCVRFGVMGVLSLVTMVGPGAADRPPQAGHPAAIQSLAPYSIVASGFEQLSAVAVDGSGAILVTDAAKGTVTRIDPSGSHRTLIDGLQGPNGIAVDRAGVVYVLEHAGKRLLRRDPDGHITVIASTLNHARSVAVDPAGRVWIAVRRDRGEDDDERQVSGSEYVIASAPRRR